MRRRDLLRTGGVALATLSGGCLSNVPFVGGNGGGGDRADRLADIDIRDRQFEPRNVELPVDTTLNWTNYDDVEHTITAATDNWEINHRLPPEGVTGQRLHEPGIYDVYCRHHGSTDPLSGMSMRIGIATEIEEPLGDGEVVSADG